MNKWEWTELSRLINFSKATEQVRTRNRSPAHIYLRPHCAFHSQIPCVTWPCMHGKFPALHDHVCIGNSLHHMIVHVWDSSQIDTTGNVNFSSDEFLMLIFERWRTKRNLPGIIQIRENSVKGQLVNILCFTGYLASVLTTQLCLNYSSSNKAVCTKKRWWTRFHPRAIIY